MKRYEDSMVRLELRWKQVKDINDVNRAVSFLKAAGVDGWVCSGVDAWGTPLFKSGVYKEHAKNANDEWLKYAIKRATDENISIIAWYPLNRSKPVLMKNPECKMVFYDYPEKGVNSKEHYYACLNTPYLDHLIEFSKELIRFGFKGIWFDLNTISMHGIEPMYAPGCLCQYCKESFKKKTGKDIPKQVDFEDDVFRQWVSWRYTILENAWAKITDAVKTVDPDATICLNNKLRKSPTSICKEHINTWNTGIPLKRLNLDLLMSCELDSVFCAQADFQMKLNRAMACHRGLETWIPLTNYSVTAQSSIELDTVRQGTLGAFCAGGNVFCGLGDYEDKKEVLRTIRESLEPVYDTRGGALVNYAAIWVSQQNMAFEGKLDPVNIWNSYHGANELLNHAHLQSGIIFDQDIDEGTINDIPVIIAASNECVSDKQIENIIEYIDNGGVFVACARFMNRDSKGESRDVSLFEDFFGILKESVKAHMAYFNVSKKVMKESYPLKVWGDFEYERIIKYDKSLSVIASSIGEDQTSISPGILVKRKGRGAFVYINCDIFKSYINTPVIYQMQLVKNILLLSKKPSLLVDAPIAVTANLYKKDNNYIVQLHNNPGGMFRYPNKCTALGDIPAAIDIRLYVKNLDVSRAYCYRANKELSIENGVVHIDKIKFHETVVLS